MKNQSFKFYGNTKKKNLQHFYKIVFICIHQLDLGFKSCGMIII